MVKCIRVLVVDDDPIVRNSLATILNAQEDMKVCGQAGNGFEAIERFEELEPDVLLMDIQMPECSGLDATQAILDKCSCARVVFLTTFSDDDYLVAALRLGAMGYLIKQEVANIAPALRSVMAGQMVLGGEVIGKVDVFLAAAVGAVSGEAAADDSTSGETIFGSAAADASSSSADGMASGAAGIAGALSEREREIIALIAQGLDNKAIAAKIYISEGTLRNHVSTMLQKLQLKNRTQLAIYYYQNLKLPP